MKFRRSFQITCSNIALFAAAVFSNFLEEENDFISLGAAFRAFSSFSILVNTPWKSDNGKNLELTNAFKGDN